MAANAKYYGLVAEFDSPAAILRAAEKVRAAGYRCWDAFTPFPIHGLDKVMGLKNSPAGWFAFFFAAGGFVAGMLMVWYMNTFDYPILTGGKPMFSPFAAFVPAYVLLVLSGAIGAVTGMLTLNGLPRFHHPVFQGRRFALASHDRFFLVIGANDPEFSETETRRLLEEAGGTHLELVEEE
jgi:hypothetical protein